jgi:hypothetical protein
MDSSAEAAEQQQQQQAQHAPAEQTAAEQAAAAEATAEAVAAAAAAAEAATSAVDGADGADAQPAQLSYASIAEAKAVNQAADSAADEAMRTVAAAQQTMHLLMNPVQPAMAAQHGVMSMEDDAGNSTHHPSGRARRSRSAQGYMDHQAHMMGMGHGHGMYGGGRPNKGLRHFSMKVCEKVESKGTTSYNEVADELVAELKDGGLDDGICYDEKNIRRRVYDAINVLMALDIIAKEKKAIIWKGFPTSRTPAQQVGQVSACFAPDFHVACDLGNCCGQGCVLATLQMHALCAATVNAVADDMTAAKALRQCPPLPHKLTPRSCLCPSCIVLRVPHRCSGCRRSS